MKKISLVFLFIFLAFILSGCLIEKRVVKEKEVPTEVLETGVVLDITEKNNQVVFVNPGDLVSLSLKSDIDSDYQWSLKEPTAEDFIKLKTHQVTSEEKVINSLWQFKILKKERFNLRFAYETPLFKKVKDVFRVKIISGENEQIVEDTIVDIPKEGDLISSPVKISGFARIVGESGEPISGTINYRLGDDNGNELASGFVTDKFGGPAFGYFERQIYFQKSSSETGILEIFQRKAKDGSEIDKVTILVKFKEYQPVYTWIKLYFSNSQFDPGILDCLKVYPVKRKVIKVSAIGQKALEELLSGPTQEEKKAGYLTSIPSGVKIQRLEIKEGVVYADFSQDLEKEVGGSCRVTAIRSQIAQTLKQFPTIKEVVISIDGRTEDILQP